LLLEFELELLLEFELELELEFELELELELLLEFELELLLEFELELLLELELELLLEFELEFELELLLEFELELLLEFELELLLELLLEFELEFELEFDDEPPLPSRVLFWRRCARNSALSWPEPCARGGASPKMREKKLVSGSPPRVGWSSAWAAVTAAEPEITVAARSLVSRFIVVASLPFRRVRSGPSGSCAGPGL
jgi:hypothetical protein